MRISLVPLVALALTSATCARFSGPGPIEHAPPTATASDDPSATPPEPPPIWGELQPGPHAVGFRMMVFEDPSRSHRLYEEARPRPRPVVAGVWYPARPGGEPRMHLRDYLELDSPQPTLDAFATAASAYLRGVVTEEAMHAPQELLLPDERDRLERALDDPAFARRDAPLASAKAPLLLGHTGLSGAYVDNVVLYEYLASHGWVVASGLFQETSGAGMYVDWNPATSLRDLAVLHDRVPTTLGVQPTLTAAIGHSYGAQAALLYATLPDRLDAVVSVDSTMENGDPAAPWWRDEPTGAWLDRPSEIRVPALLLASPEPDRSFFDAMGSAPRELVTVPGLEHNDFIGTGGAIRVRAGACESAEACAELHRRHLAVVATVAEFLDAMRPEQRSSSPLASDAFDELGIRTERVLEPAAPPPTEVPALPPRDPAPDCRADDSCDPALLAVTHATELQALGRADEGIARLDAALAAGVEPAWLLHETRGLLLASQQRYEDAARAFGRTAADGPGPFRDRAASRQRRAETLAASR